jgi:hypothetical protein
MYVGPLVDTADKVKEDFTLWGELLITDAMPVDALQLSGVDTSLLAALLSHWV